MTESVVKQFADLIFARLQSKRWLYWPPGPMVQQVFNREQCQKDLTEFFKPQQDELALVREVLNTDLKAAQDRVFTLELEAQQHAAYHEGVVKALTLKLEYAEADMARLASEKRKQLGMLYTIRTLADEATGTNRTAGDERESGAIGAVRHLIAQFTKLKETR